MASLQHDDAVRHLARRWAGSAALLALALAAACGGGDRNRSSAADTAAAAAPMDSTAMPMADTATPASVDSPARSGAPDSAAAKPPAVAATKPAPAPAPAPRPAKPAETATKPAAAPQPKPAAKTDSGAAPAPTAPPAQDTTKAATPPADAPLRDAYHLAPKDTVTQAVYNGWKQFNLNCARCHGEDVMGTTIAPHLIVSLRGPINTKEIFVQTVCAGRPEKGMPAWCALGLGLDKINDIYEYVKGRSDSKISPGRPAVKQQG